MTVEIPASGRSPSAVATTQPVTPVRQSVIPAAQSGGSDTVSISTTATRLNRLELVVNISSDDQVVAERKSVSEPQSGLAEIRAAFLSKSSDAKFNASVDFNSDGRINFADLAALKASQQSASDTDAPVSDDAPQPVTLGDVRDAFRSSEGDDNFNAAADLNGDGQVNFADLAALKASQQQADDTPRPVTLADVRNAFMSGEGDDNFNAAADLNGDGQVNFADLAALKASQQQADDTPRPVTLGDVRDAFRSSEGDDNFNAAADLNGDGQVNFADLAALKASQQEQADDTPQPVTLGDVRDAFMSGDGDDNFNAAADLNGDGRVNFADLAAFKASQQQQADDTPQPVTLGDVRDAFMSGDGDDNFNAAADLNGDGRVNFADLAAFKASQQTQGINSGPGAAMQSDPMSSIRESFQARAASATTADSLHSTLIGQLDTSLNENSLRERIDHIADSYGLTSGVNAELIDSLARKDS